MKTLVTCCTLLRVGLVTVAATDETNVPRMIVWLLPETEAMFPTTAGCTISGHFRQGSGIVPAIAEEDTASACSDTDALLQTCGGCEGAALQY